MSKFSPYIDQYCEDPGNPPIEKIKAIKKRF